MLGSQIPDEGSVTMTVASPPTSSNNTGTAPTGQGPGTGTALESALSTYLAQQLAAAGANGSYGDLPLPQATAPQVTVVQAPAAQGGGNLPMIVAGVATVIGVASGVAYLMDRRRKGKKA